MITRMLFGAITLLVLFVPSIQAQSSLDWNPQGLTMQRDELEELLGRLNDVANSPGYSGTIRESARRDAALIRDRLEEGDFRVGDRVRISVAGESDIPPELAVEPGPKITIPVIGSISLAGVLRSELQEYLTQQLGLYIQNPVVQADAEIRLSIQGGVGAPGFYTVPADMLVGEALMMAGGPGQASDLNELRIERGNQRLWEGEELQEVIAEGRTLDQLNLQAGDQIVLPGQQPGSFWNSTWGTVTRWGLAIGSTVLFGVRIFGGGF